MEISLKSYEIVLALSLKQKQPYTNLVPVSDGNQPLSHTSVTTLRKYLNASLNSVCWLLTLKIFKGENLKVNKVENTQSKFQKVTYQ
jgi:hypothetical protein